MTPITLDQYAGPYLDHPDFTAERRANAEAWLKVANECLQLAEDDGVVLQVNPHTGCYLAGDGNGGFRPQDCPVGAQHSGHKEGRAGDLYDTERTLAAWSLLNEARLKAAGIAAMENPRWTPTWTHWQTRILPSGNFVFIPSPTPPLAAALPEQMQA